jgi:ABC-type Co2+ transport system permease subunit
MKIILQSLLFGFKGAGVVGAITLILWGSAGVLSDGANADISLKPWMAWLYVSCMVPFFFMGLYRYRRKQNDEKHLAQLN